jgi:tetratricopeptide (TPR) repeat protein
MQKTQKLKNLRLQIDKIWHGREKTSDGDYEKIVDLYFQILKLEPKDTNSWEDTVWLLWSLSINKKNIRYLDTAERVVLDYLKHNNNGYRAYEYVGLFYRQYKPDTKRAILYYQSAVKFSDCTISGFRGLTTLFASSGDKMRAIENCKFTLRHFPNDSWTKNKIDVLSSR